MDWSALGLAVIPPSLAIAVEALNPVNKRSIKNSFDADLKVLLPVGGGPPATEAPAGFDGLIEDRIGHPAASESQTVKTQLPFSSTVDMATISSVAAVEVSGLAPTLVASVTSGFAVLHELPEPFWPAILYTLIFVTLVLFVMWLLSGSTFYAIGENKVEIQFKRGLELQEPSDASSGRTREQRVKTVIYLANICLIIAAFLVFGVLNWHHLIHVRDEYELD